MESRRQSPGSQAGTELPVCPSSVIKGPCVKKPPGIGEPLWTCLLSSLQRVVRRAEGSHCSILGLGLGTLACRGTLWLLG